MIPWPRTCLTTSPHASFVSCCDYQRTGFPIHFACLLARIDMKSLIMKSLWRDYPFLFTIIPLSPFNQIFEVHNYKPIIFSLANSAWQNFKAVGSYQQPLHPPLDIDMRVSRVSSQNQVSECVSYNKNNFRWPRVKDCWRNNCENCKYWLRMSKPRVGMNTCRSFQEWGTFYEILWIHSTSVTSRRKKGHWAFPPSLFWITELLPLHMSWTNNEVENRYAKDSELDFVNHTRAVWKIAAEVYYCTPFSLWLNAASDSLFSSFRGHSMRSAHQKLL